MSREDKKFGLTRLDKDGNWETIYPTVIVPDNRPKLKPSYIGDGKKSWLSKNCYLLIGIVIGVLITMIIG